MAEFTRRRFAQALAASAGVYVSAGAAASSWYDEPLRWGQLTLVENDPPKLDVAFWAEFWQRCHLQAVTLSAGGVVCYYPTRVPLHHKSRWMGNRDPFGELVAAARRLNLRVVARVDTHAVHPDFLEAHPGWIARDSQGNPVHHWVMPELYLTSFIGPYHWEYVPQIIREIHAMYDVDGIFANRWDSSPPAQGVCYCEYCRNAFRKFSGKELPRRADAADPVWRAFTGWRERQALAIWKHWDQASKAAHPGGTFFGTHGGGVTQGIDWKALAGQTDILDADNQGRSDFTPVWRNGEMAKVERSVMGRKPILGIFGTTLATRHRWYLSTKTDPEQRLWIAEGVAHGFRPWWTAFGGAPEDRRWMPVVERFYQWHHRNERYFRNTDSLAAAGLVYSQQTAKWYGGERAQDAFRGMYQVLLHERIPFDLVHEGNLDEARRYKLLVLPNLAALSDAQCEQIRRYVAQGGSVVATHETSLYDEQGRARKDFGLGDLFGVRLKAAAHGPIRNSYLRLEESEKQHPLLEGLQNTPLVVNTIWNVGVEPREGTDRLLWVVPSFPDLPMEKVFTDVRRSNDAIAHVRSGGRGRVVYFAGDLDRTYWEVLAADHRRLLGNALRWALNGGSPVRVIGPGLVDVSIFRQKDSIAVHLVNLTNPMLWKGPVEELIPIGEQQVEIDVPAHSRVTLLAEGKPARFTRKGQRLRVTVPSILDYEIVAIDL